MAWPSAAVSRARNTSGCNAALGWGRLDSGSRSDSPWSEKWCKVPVASRPVGPTVASSTVSYQRVPDSARVTIHSFDPGSRGSASGQVASTPCGNSAPSGPNLPAASRFPPSSSLGRDARSAIGSPVSGRSSDPGGSLRAILAAGGPAAGFGPHARYATTPTAARTATPATAARHFRTADRLRGEVALAIAHLGKSAAERRVV